MGPMTRGERMIWSMALVRSYLDATSDPPAAIFEDQAARDDWENDQAEYAVDVAHALIRRLRAVRKLYEQECMMGDEAAQMLAEIVGEE